MVAVQDVDADLSPAAEKVVRRRPWRRESLAAYAFLAPQLIGLFVFTLGPLVFAVILAFSN